MAKRFRVALSFPGEHRDRVEKIAEALAGKLGREKVLYDRWWAAEFNREDLDVYLPRLYHDGSELIAVFLCQEYVEKDWCGLEWRACRDLIKRRAGARRMYFRLDDADVPGLYSIDGYQDMRHMSDAEVAASILSQLPATGGPPTYRAFTSKLPVVNPTLIGREKELKFLDRAWAELTTNFVQIIAAGGTGKTALVDKWFRRHLGEATVFGWSFYSEIGLDHLSLARAHPSGSPEAERHLSQAVDFLRRSGRLDYLPRALLARGTDRDLDEVFRIATRSGMRLFLADYHLAKGNLAEAERLINETGYHRRDAEFAKLKANTPSAGPH